MRSRIVLGLALCLAAGFAQSRRPAPPHAAAKTKAKVKQKTPPAPKYDAAAVNNSGTRDKLMLKDAGSAALRAQILLDRANFSVGQIDGRIGTNTIRVLAGYRMSHNLPAGDGIDDDVWNALNADTAQVLMPYGIAPDDLKGPFTQVPADMMAKAKLEYLGYASPLDAIAEKFHVSPMLLKQLNPGHTFNMVNEQILVPNVITDLNTPAASLIVSKSQSTLTVIDDQGKIIAQYPCTSGSEHDPLPIGDWKITSVDWYPKFHYNPDLFWDANPKDAKATIPPGPRNPVGVVWMNLSKEHYGIHGTPDASRIGYAQSHGCIRLTNWDAAELAKLVKPGTTASLVE
jgi:lipoprotein-anchoring transpeptidase ErfK/SrfK